MRGLHFSGVVISSAESHGNASNSPGQGIASRCVEKENFSLVGFMIEFNQTVPDCRHRNRLSECRKILTRPISLKSSRGEIQMEYHGISRGDHRKTIERRREVGKSKKYSRKKSRRNCRNSFIALHNS